MLRDAADQHGLKLISEVMDISQIALMDRYVGHLSRWARATCRTTRCCASWAGCASRCCSSAGISATIEEWLLSAEYILSGGNMQVILCERGIRTFETYTRNTMDISAIPVVKKLSHLPIFADPSHGIGKRDKVAAMARAAIAAGADGLLIEVHCDPDKALSDGAQSLFPGQFDRLMAELRIIAPAIGRSICVESTARGLGHVGLRRARCLEAFEPPFRPSSSSAWLVGGSVGLAARRQWPDVASSALDRREVVRDAIVVRRRHRARLRAWRDSSGSRISSSSRRRSRRNRALVDEIAALAAVGTVVTDVGSTKRDIVAGRRARMPD